MYTQFALELVLLALVCGLTPVESVSYKTKFYLNDLLSSISALEAMASGLARYGREITGTVEANFKPQQLKASYRLLSTLDSDTIKQMKTKTPRLYAFRRALMTVPIDGMDTKAHQYFLDLIKVHQKTRKSFLGGDVDNAKLLAGTATGALAESLSCSEFAFAMPLTSQLVDDAAAEISDRMSFYFDETYSDMDIFELVEQNAIYLGNVPQSILSSHVLSKYKSGHKELADLIQAYKSMIENQGYKPPCPIGGRLNE